MHCSEITRSVAGIIQATPVRSRPVRALGGLGKPMTKTEAIATDDVRDALAYCPNLPSLSSVAVKVVQLAREPDPDATQLAHTLSQDPALASRVLRTSNSPLYAQRRTARTLHQAISILGLNTTITVALSFALADSLRTSAQAAYVNDYVWRRSLLGAMASREIGQTIGHRDPESLFLAGLMQDIGILALQTALPERYGAITNDRPTHQTLIERERQAFGCDHAQAGAWLLAQWHLPDYLIEAVAGSHAALSPGRKEQRARLPCVVSLASTVAELFLAGDGHVDPGDVASEAGQFLDLDGAALTEALDRISEQIPSTEALFETTIVSATYAAGVVDQAREILTTRQLEMIRQMAAREQEASELEESTRQWRETAHRDRLTGLNNRWHLDQRLDGEFALARDNQWPLTVAFIDLDHFKAVNDRHGHLTGDRILAEAAKILAVRLRDGDCVARYGGEEFIVLLPGTDREHASMVMERLRSALESTRFMSDDGHPIEVTASIGLTVFEPGTREVDGPSTLVREADRALYDAKERGRNRVERFLRQSA